MHSRQKVLENYPWIAEILPALYAHPVRDENGSSYQKPGKI